VHTAILPSAAAPATAAAAAGRRPSRLHIAFFGRPAAAATCPPQPGCRAATLPPIDDLHDACAPEGALYVDGVLFGGI